MALAPFYRNGIATKKKSMKSECISATEFQASSIDRLDGHLGFCSRPRFPNSRYALGQEPFIYWAKVFDNYLCRRALRNRGLHSDSFSHWSLIAFLSFVLISGLFFLSYLAISSWSFLKRRIIPVATEKVDFFQRKLA
jgi:hypothetical protein